MADQSAYKVTAKLGGLDAFLIGSREAELSDEAVRLRRAVRKVLSHQPARPKPQAQA